jgi:hypothetical protein
MLQLVKEHLQELNAIKQGIVGKDVVIGAEP